MQKSVEQGLHFSEKAVAGLYCFRSSGRSRALSALSLGIPWLLGEKYIPSIGPLQVMAFVPLVVAMSNVMGYETMLPLGMEKIYSKVLITASIFNLIIICPLISWKGAEGTALAVLCTETMVTVIMAVVLWKKRILLR